MLVKRRRRKPLVLFMVMLMFLSSFTGFTPVQPVQAEETGSDAIADGHLRIHYDYADYALSDIGAWLWGDVTNPSDQVSEWPDGIWFEDGGTDDYGAYVDVEIKDDAENIGLVINNRSGEKLTEDISIDVLSEQMNEVWISTEGQIYYYEPADLGQNVLRVHFSSEAESYEPWGVWTWGDVIDAPETWPTDAQPFSNEQVGRYGAYVDVPLTENPGSLGFLLVKRDDTAEQTSDMTFSDFDNHQQIFLKEGVEGYFTNPYYVATDVEEEVPEEQEGKHDIKVDGSVNRAFTYNEHAVLSVDITNNSEQEIHSIYADTTALGGKERLAISPELNEVTLSVRHDIEPGEKAIPVTVVDEDGGTYKTEVTATVEARAGGESNVDWDESVIYFMLTDRFYDGNKNNNDPYGLNYDRFDNQRGTYQGGDFKGVMDKLDYLDELGVNTIWITPIVENVGYDVNYNASEGSYFAYHGYWAKNFEKLNPHLGTLEEFHALIDAAAERDIKIMADVVLNHAGYGLKESVTNAPPGYPTNEDRARFDGMLRETSSSGDEKMELSGLPDFKTEETQVREQLVEWQKNWIKKSTTANGNSLAYYRVDTVKHVDGTTWQHFRNQLTKEKPDFQLIGEAWGASQHDDQGYLRSGMMDSLLDFEFKGTAKNFVNGDLDSANETLIARNQKIDNTAMLGQFLGSHDEDGFLYSLGGDEGKLKVAASLQMTAKGQPVIYYGEELGQSGANNWPEYDNRYNFDWDSVEGNDVLAHYQSMLSFREEHSDIFAKGSRQKIAGSDQEQFLLFERVYQGDNVYVGLNVKEESQSISLKVDQASTTITDHYYDKTYEPTENQAGEYVITLPIPSMADGGTLLLTVENGTVLAGEAEEEPNEQPATSEIPEGHLRVHFPGNNESFDELGLWVWEDVATKSEDVGAWPSAASSFEEVNQTEYGRYVDVELVENAKQVGMLINHTNGDNLSGDIMVEVLSPEMNQVWLTEDYQVYYYQPLDNEGEVRVNFYQEEGSYNDLGLWTWGDVAQPTDNWPDGAHSLSDERIGLKGSYVDLPLAEEPSQIGFLFLNKQTDWQTSDYTFENLDDHSQIFVRKDDNTVYTNPYFVKEEGLVKGEVLSDQQIELGFTSVTGLSQEILAEEITISDKEGQDVGINSVTISEDNNTVLLNGDFHLDKAPFTIAYQNKSVTASIGWRLKDEMYGYDGELGLEVHDQSNATLKVWSPSADHISVILYDKDDPKQVIKDDIEMTRGEKGVWEVDLHQENTGLDNLIGYYYHFAIERDGETVLALDPYAKSMAAWDSSDPDVQVGKAAIVDTDAIGPKLEYANIEGFKKREDAVIYEIHVRDFTSDPSIDEELESKFGTFASFIEKLDYIEDLGVTHIQLLPVMSYYFSNELNKDQRLLDYSSEGNNYNWGYDPHSYFSLSGMYSEYPTDPEKRIEEFKLLIDEIHRRGMGVILDVVYNHTARVNILEDLEPNYYHFMNADGTPRESFGGGRLGTTHKMARRILVDSIKYWVGEFKVDGFRFDMMGDHDAESIQMAYDEAKALNPNILMIGEGWRTFAGDENYPDVQPADQDWMQDTNSVASFSDEFRNELKSGFGSEGQPRFITGGARNIQTIFNNVTANPGNFTADDPGDVVPYIAAHDNLTLHDVIAQSIKKDPKDHTKEIHKRIRLGNLMVLTSQGTPFIHAGQEYGRTKQFRHEDYKGEVAEAPNKSTFLIDENGEPFEYPYFIHDSYDSTDAINKFEWEKATNQKAYPIETTTVAYTKGLIELRRSTDAFRLATMEQVNKNVSLIEAPEIAEQDLVIGYRAEDSSGDETYYVFANADDQERSLTLDEDLSAGEVIVDGSQAGTRAITEPEGVSISENAIELAPLTSAVIRITNKEEEPTEPGEGDQPSDNEDEDKEEGKGNNSNDKPSAPGKKPNIPGKPGKEVGIPEHVFEKVPHLKKILLEVPEEEDQEDRISVTLSKEEVKQYQSLPLVVKQKDVQVSLPLDNADGKAIRLGLEKQDINMNLPEGMKLVAPVYRFDVTDENGNSITKFDSPVTLTFKVDEKLIDDPSLLRGVYLAEDGSNQFFQGRYNEEAGTFQFDVDHFSTFTVMEVDENLLEEKEETGESQLPDTATSIYNYLLFGVILLLIAAGILIYQRRKQ
ncbi:pullulanase [Gracilibacillus sp. D59]|uniref:pullulanase n=1 Tax=Gracilibacillus sp. D59 TaxID=3457434 RepID=UPI003FCE31D0